MCSARYTLVLLAGGQAETFIIPYPLPCARKKAPQGKQCRTKSISPFLGATFVDELLALRTTREKRRAF